MVSRIDDVGRGARRPLAGVARSDSERDGTLPGDAEKSKPKKKPKRTRSGQRFRGEVLDGEYSDGNLRGITFIAGKRGSGKSWLQWEELALCVARVVIFDTLGQYRAPKYNLAQWVVISTPGMLRAYLAQNLQPRDLKYFQDIIGQATANLPKLEQYHYLKWTDDCAEPQILTGIAA